MKKIMYYSHLILSCCILLNACTPKNDFKITKEFADSVKQYSYISSFSEERAIVSTYSSPNIRIEEKFGFIDKTGKQIIPCIYDNAYSFSEGMAKVRIGEKYGFIDKNGKQIIPCIYDNAHSFSEGMSKVEIGGKYGFIDKNGKQVIPCIYDNAYSFSEGMSKVEIGGKYGFVDKYGTSTFDFDKE